MNKLYFIIIILLLIILFLIFNRDIEHFSCKLNEDCSFLGSMCKDGKDTLQCVNIKDKNVAIKKWDNFPCEPSKKCSVQMSICNYNNKELTCKDNEWTSSMK